jgi:hypothetical protein
VAALLNWSEHSFVNFRASGVIEVYRWKVQQLPVPAHFRLSSWWCPGVLQRHFKIGPLEPCTLFENRSFLSSDGHMPCIRYQLSF